MSWEASHYKANEGNCSCALERDTSHPSAPDVLSACPCQDVSNPTQNVQESHSRTCGNKIEILEHKGRLIKIRVYAILITCLTDQTQKLFRHLRRMLKLRNVIASDTNALCFHGLYLLSS